MQPLAAINVENDNMNLAVNQLEPGVANPLARRPVVSPEIVGSVINTGDSLSSMQIKLPPKTNVQESGLGTASRHLSNTVGEVASELFGLFGSKGNKFDPNEDMQTGLGLRTLASNNMQQHFKPPAFGL